jgi:hypothetical protein
MYTLLEKDRIKYISLILLNEIIQFQHYFPVKLRGEDVFLEPFLQGMLNKGLLRIENNYDEEGNSTRYVPTDLGREELVTLYNKYYEFLKFFDIFCAVDLGQGEFAFSSINNEWSDDQWFEFLHQERFSDVRVAVADFKGIDPIEIVFMSFLNENRFDCTQPRWQYFLTGHDVWNEILEICNSAVSLDYLKSEGVIENVVQEGTNLVLELIKQAEQVEEQGEVIIEETVTEEVIDEYVDIVEMPTYGYSYWEPYYDPFYISPIWLVPVLLW